MKALVFENGSLRFDADHALPRRRDGEALVRVTLAGICATDLEIVKGYMGFEGVLGHEFVGVVEETGNSRLRGRRVTGEINISCGNCDYCRSGLERHCPGRAVLGIAGKDGAFAEYLTIPEANLHPLPDGVSDEEAVFIEPLAAAFEVVEQVDLDSGRDVCVLGDGRLGLLVAQVVSLQAGCVLAIGRHPEKLAILEARGIATAGGTDRAFDVVVDCTGSASGIEEALALVKPRGTIVLKTTVAGERPADLNQIVIDEITLLGSRCGPFKPAVEALASGKVDVRPLISGKFPLEDGLQALDFAGIKGVMKVILEVGA